MLTNLTNLTRSATQTLLTNGTRSLDLVVNVNMATVSVSRGRHRSHLQVERFKLTGNIRKPDDPKSIWDNDFKEIPTLPSSVVVSESHRFRLPVVRAWSSSDSMVWRSDFSGAWNRCRVDQSGQRAGYPACVPASRSASPSAQKTPALEPRKAPARTCRAHLLGG